MDELLTPQEMQQADRLAIAAGIPGIELMERAGRAMAEAVAEFAPGPVTVVAGSGNNGGDGFVTARLLREAGRDVKFVLLGARANLKGDAAFAAARWTGPVDDAASADFGNAGVIVDALFGAGLARPIEGAARSLVERINASGRPVVAVDLPSGIDGASGAVRGVAVRAQRSVTFFRKKPGHILLPGRTHCGRVTVHDIGIPDSVLDTIQPRAWLNRPLLWGQVLPRPQIDGHKYKRGHAVVVSGPMPNTGAARLSARGALRAGAGLVTLASPADAVVVHAMAAPDAFMVRAVDSLEAFTGMLEDHRITALVLGPAGGVGERMRAMVLAACEAGRGLVLDADALTSFEDSSETLFLSFKTNASDAILTPHTGELKRLFASNHQATDLGDKLQAARAAAAMSSAIVVLKGADTVVAAPSGEAAIADNAPPWLATGGSGDVLAGIAGGLLAQGMPVFEAACAAVWLHGEAGREVGPGLIADDLPDALRPVYRRLYAEMD